MKKAIIIGGSSGIGEKLADLLSSNDYTVAITGRRESLLKKITERHPNSMIYRVFDVTEVAMLARNLDVLCGQLGGCDLLIISAGTGDVNPGLDFEIEKKIIETNITGFTAAADWAFRYFQTQGAGHLAGISSVAGIRGSRHAPAYGASKAYQINYLEGLRQKAGNLKIPVTVIDIRPGYVNTKMAKGPGQFWVASPEKAAAQIFRALKKKRKVVYITKRWALVALIFRNIPAFIFNKL